MTTTNCAVPVIAASVLLLSPGGVVISAGAADSPSTGTGHVSQLAPASPPSAAPAGAPHTGGAPVIANESIVTGEVLAVSLIDSSAVNVRPARMLARLTLRIGCIHEAPSKANLLAGRTGEVIEVHSHDVTLTQLVGKTVNGRIVFRGDERGGSYWVAGPVKTGSLCSDSQE